MNNEIQIYEHVLNVLKDLLDEKYTLAARLQREAEQRFAELNHEDINRHSVYLVDALRAQPSGAKRPEG